MEVEEAVENTTALLGRQRSGSPISYSINPALLKMYKKEAAFGSI